MAKKNKLEKKFSQSLKADENLWGVKLHNNMLAHQTTVGDYWINYADRDYYEHLQSCVVECKQVTLKDEKGRLAFKRLKQMHDLLAFEERFESHHAFFCIAFLNLRWDDSEVYIIPVKIMKRFIDDWPMVSINRMEMRNKFGKYLVGYNNQVIDLRFIRSFV